MTADNKSTSHLESVRQGVGGGSSSAAGMPAACISAMTLALEGHPLPGASIASGIHSTVLPMLDSVHVAEWYVHHRLAASSLPQPAHDIHKHKYVQQRVVYMVRAHVDEIL